MKTRSKVQLCMKGTHCSLDKTRREHDTNVDICLPLNLQTSLCELSNQDDAATHSE